MDLRNIESLPSGNFRARVQKDGRVYRSPVSSYANAVEWRDDFESQENTEAFFDGDRVEIAGNTAEDFNKDAMAQAALQRLIGVYNQSVSLDDTRQNQTIKFPAHRWMVVFTGDVHLGDEGTDHARAFDEASLISEMPNTSVFLMADLLNNFINPKHTKVRFTAPATIEEEWALLEYYLTQFRPGQIIGAVADEGHDGWTDKLTGYEAFRSILARLAPNALYDKFDVRVNLATKGGYTVRARMRHKWRGTSMWNPTQGIEKAARFDQDFELGVGAHFHGNGVARTFNVATQTGLAVQVGTYKSLDDYGRELGLPGNNASVTAIAVLFDGLNHTIQAFDNLALAAEVIQALS